MKNKITNILEHNISWYVESNRIKELDSCSIEHIENSITDGYTSGSLNVTYGKNNNLETSGYWSIVDWKDIALELYKAQTLEEKKKATKRFDENWG